jgi:hypothetical protein
MEKTLIYNAVQCNLCNDVIESYHRHDFKKCSCKNVTVDGGLDYIRYGWAGAAQSITPLYLYIEDNPFSVIREYFYRWNVLKQEYVKLKDVSNDWLEALLEYYIPPGNKGEMNYKYLTLFIEEKLYRNEQEYN